MVLGSWFLVLGSGRPRSQGARGSRFSVLGSRFGTPALPGGTWFSVPGSWFSVRDARAPRDAQDCAYAGGDARAPRGHVVLGSWFLVLGSGRPRSQGRAGLRVCGRGRPRTQGACGSRFLVLGSRFLVLGSWFLVPGSWFSVRDARAPRDALRRSPAGASTCSARASARSLRLHPHPFATCSRRNCANTIRPVWV